MDIKQLATGKHRIERPHQVQSPLAGRPEPDMRCTGRVEFSRQQQQQHRSDVIIALYTVRHGYVCGTDLAPFRLHRLWNSGMRRDP